MTIFKTAARTLLTGTCLLLAAAPASAQDTSGPSTSGWITPTLTVFDFSRGFGNDLTQVLERYDYRRAIGGDRRTGVLLDVGDLWVANWADGRPRWRAQRQAPSYDNQRGSLQFDSSAARVRASYGYLRTASDGVNYLYSPLRVRGGTDPEYNGGTVGYFRTFNDESRQTLFRVGRSQFGATVGLKADGLRDVGSLTFSYDRSARSGNRFSSYLLGGSDVAGPADARAQLRWRAYDRTTDDSLNTGGLQFTLSPRGVFTLDYQLSVDRFRNQAPDYELAGATSGVGFSGDPAVTAFFAAGRQTASLQYLPDSGLITNRVTATKRLGRRGVVSAGYAKSVLDQKTFHAQQTELRFTSGQITTDTAFANATVRPSGRVGIEARATYANRSNDSSFPVPGLFDPNSAFDKPRLDAVRKTGVGIEATVDTGLPRSSLAFGYQRDTADRDITFGVTRGIPSQRSFYTELTELDRIYARFVSRPVKGVNLRLRASKVTGDKTGLPTEPEKGADLYGLVGYAAPNGASVSGFYGVRTRANDQTTFTGGPAPGGTSTHHHQDGTFASAGVVTSYVPAERAGMTFSYVWAQTDFETNFISTNIRRFDSTTALAAIVYTTRQPTRSAIDTHAVSIGGDLRPSDRVTLSTSYMLTAARGDVASGAILAALPAPDARVDNSLHTLALSADYAVQSAWTLRASYAFDYYSDASYKDLTGGRHAVMIGLVFGF